MSSVTAAKAPKSTAYLSAPGAHPRVPSSHMPTPTLAPIVSETSSCPRT